MDGHDGIQPMEAPSVGTIHQPADGAVISLPGVGVAYGGCEKVDQEPQGTFFGPADQRRQAISDSHRTFRHRVDGEFLGHRISCFWRYFGR